MKLSNKMISEIEEIVARGNTAEVKKIKDAVTVLEAKREKKILVPVNGQE